MIIRDDIAPQNGSQNGAVQAFGQRQNLMRRAARPAPDQDQRALRLLQQHRRFFHGFRLRLRFRCGGMGAPLQPRPLSQHIQGQ